MEDQDASAKTIMALTIVTFAAILLGGFFFYKKFDQYKNVDEFNEMRDNPFAGGG